MIQHLAKSDGEVRLDDGIAARPRSGESLVDDAFVVQTGENGVLSMVIDDIGSGADGVRVEYNAANGPPVQVAARISARYLIGNDDALVFGRALSREKL